MHLRYRFVFLLLAFTAPSFAAAQTTGGCALGEAEADLFVNDVRARLFNTGGLFWKGQGNVYNVPASSDGVPNAIFAASLWMGGKVDGEIRTVAANYGGWELYPGPLDVSGNAPTDCTPYDRIFTVTKADIAAYEASGEMSDDLRDWPQAWGAPVVDGDGDPDNYNFAGGDRPELLGHETHWWVMNDVAGPHGNTGTPPMNVEVRVTAFGADSDADAIAQTTFYRYRLTYRGTQPLTDAYVGLYVDPDLGNATDDYVGSDTTLDMGFVYNGDDFDEGSGGYGAAPPALGTVFLDGLDEMHPDREMSVFLYYDGFSAPYGDPRGGRASDWYNYLRGVWLDGKPIVTCGNGYDPSFYACADKARPTTFMWSGDPVTGAFWSDRNPEGSGYPNPPNDRRYVTSTGPFTMQPGETKDVVFAIVYARGADHLDSVTELRKAVVTVREAWKSNFQNVPPLTAPTAPAALVSPADGVADQPTRLQFRWEAVEHARTYDFELRLDDGETPRDTVLSFFGDTTVMLDLDTLGTTAPGTVVTWRVRGRNSSGAAPWSAARAFTLSGETLVGAEGRFTDFLTVANADGPLSPPEYGAFAFNGSGFPHPTTSDRPDGSRQQTSGVLAAQQGWGIFTFGEHRRTYDEWYSRVTSGGSTSARIGQNDFEWRFTGTSVAERPFGDAGAATMTVPFELWNVGTQPGAEDDYRMIPWICEAACGAGGPANEVFDVGGDSPLSGGPDDPISDAVYWYNPADTSPGEAGYRAWEAEVLANGVSAASGALVGEEVLKRVTLMAWNFGDGTAPYPQTRPEEGTIFRLATSKKALSPPAVSAPADGAVLERTATWLYWQEPARRPAARIVELARDAAFAGMVQSDTVSTAGAHAISSLAPGQAYWWRVRFVYPGDLLSPWSAAQTFSVSPTATAIDTDAALPAALALDAPYPNPARERVTVRFGLPEAGPVRVALYDVLGREVQRLADGAHAAGWHEATLETSSLASGLYLVRVVAEGRQQTRAVVVAR